MTSMDGTKLGLALLWRRREKEARDAASNEGYRADHSRSVIDRAAARSDELRLSGLADILGDAWRELADGLIESHGEDQPEPEPEPKRHAMRGVTVDPEELATLEVSMPTTRKELLLRCATLHEDLARRESKNPGDFGSGNLTYHREMARGYRHLAEAKPDAARVGPHASGVDA